MSRLRLVSSYCFIALILAIGVGGMVTLLPLAGEAEIRRVAAAAQPAQTSPGYVVNRSPGSYPIQARQKRIEGTVIVELTFNARGDIVDSRVLSGPEELRQAGLQTALQGGYGIDIARTLQVVVDFKLPPAAQRGAAPRSPTTGISAEPGLFGEISGSVADASGNLLPGVTVTIRSKEDTNGRDTVMWTDAKGEYRFPNVPPGTYMLSAALTPFQTITYSTVPLAREQKVRLNFMLRLTSASAPLPQQSPVPGGQPSVLPGSPPPPPNPSVTLRVGKNVVASNLVTVVPPVYPVDAQQNQIRGTVNLEARIDQEGRVASLTVLDGHPLLVQAAIDAVRQWVYRPILLNGQAVDVVTTISVNIPFQN
jgi:TonB family protein